MSLDDEDIPAHSLQSHEIHENHSSSNTNVRNHESLTRRRAKKIQEQVNSFLAEINFDIFKNIILPKILYICLDKGYIRMSYCWTKE